MPEPEASSAVKGGPDGRGGARRARNLDGGTPMAALTLLAMAGVMVCFFLWWRGRVTVTAGLGVVAVAALVAVVVFLMGAPHPASN